MLGIPNGVSMAITWADGRPLIVLLVASWVAVWGLSCGSGAVAPRGPLQVAVEASAGEAADAGVEEPVVPEAPDSADRCASFHEALSAPDPAVVRIFLSDDGTTCVDDVDAADEASFSMLCRRAVEAGARRAVVYADARVPYGRVVEVMGGLREAGVEGVSVGVGGADERVW